MNMTWIDLALEILCDAACGVAIAVVLLIPCALIVWALNKWRKL